MSDPYKVINIDFLRQCLSYDTVGQHLLSCYVAKVLVTMLKVEEINCVVQLPLSYLTHNFIFHILKPFW